MPNIKELIDIANQHEAETGQKFSHVNSIHGASRYIRDARIIQKLIKPGGRILDLGTGCGQMSYLLRNMGFTIMSTDLFSDPPYFVTQYNKKHSDPIEYCSCNILEKIPAILCKQEFDAICISGVLEHVPDFSRFLIQLKALLKLNGKLFVFRFPNRYSWIEKINDVRFGNTADHPIRFSLSEVHFMLRWHGFRIDNYVYEEILPINLNGFPGLFKVIYDKLYKLTTAASWIVCHIPILNRIATSFRFVTTKIVQ